MQRDGGWLLGGLVVGCGDGGRRRNGRRHDTLQRRLALPRLARRQRRRRSQVDRLRLVIGDMRAKR